MSETLIDQMWEKFAEHQPFADERGYGEAWRRMCEERTEEAADAAFSAAWDVARTTETEVTEDAVDAAAYAAAWAAGVAWDALDAADAERCAEHAIDCINQAEENK
jgi:hypothetical protein